MSDCLFDPTHGTASNGMLCFRCHAGMTAGTSTNDNAYADAEAAGWMSPPFRDTNTLHSEAASSVRDAFDDDAADAEWRPPTDDHAQRELDAYADLDGPGSIDASVEAYNVMLEALERGVGLEDHHLLPQEFNFFFLLAGLDIDKYTMTIPADLHRDLHKMWNMSWKDFIVANEFEPDREAIMAEAARLVNASRGLLGRRLHVYRKFGVATELV